ncbi:MAG TPA: YeeE/YedE thiosulfate transporter family protein, partial [Methylomirabilota bacterium]|nr:YeeE/YedE thiosulfate transporter family protein [Methylomirabilota bacterium]
GLGASGAAHRIAVFGIDVVASAHVDRTPGLASAKQEGHPLDDWLVFEVFGVFLGGAVAAYSAGRLRSGVQRGPRISVPARLASALGGGVLMGIAARMARGCTSGQALTGGALLSVGSWVFMFAVFAGGYALAYVLRREWT